MEQKKNLGLADFRNFLTQNTAYFLSKELAGYQEMLRELTGSQETGKNLRGEISANAPSIRLARNRIFSITNLLNRQIYMPKDQTEKISLGSGVILTLNGERKEYFIDSTRVGPCKKIVSLNSPFGEILFGKTAGESGTFVARNKILEFEILQLLPYSEAKKILKTTHRVIEPTAVNY